MDDVTLTKESKSGSKIIFLIVVLKSISVTILNTLVSYYRHGPLVPDWNLPYQLSVKFLETLLICLFLTLGIPHLTTFQLITTFPCPIPWDGSIKKINNFCTPNRKVIEFLKANCPGHWPPDSDNVNHSIYGEWITTNINQDSPFVIYMLHGGGYFSGSMQLNRRMAYHLSKHTGYPVFGVNFRLAPQTSYPCALIDVLSGYLKLLETYDSKHIVLMGDSAGGGMVLSSMALLRDMKLPLPVGGYMMSPWCDLSNETTNHYEENTTDYLPTAIEGKGLKNRFHLYIPDQFAKLPYVSPYWIKNFEQLPPILIQCGSVETLHDEIIAFVTKANHSGWKSITLEIYKVRKWVTLMN
ncbi:Alpha/Beta hydrolase protein [Globomyces pollinis-pini]|nr:Alpha/Beta hydrolase protein [Globomyces pollinis-pini]